MSNATAIVPNEWKETKLGKLVKIGRGSSPRPIQEYLAPSGIPWIKIADATRSTSRYINETREFIKEEGRSTSVNVGDLIVSNSASPGIPKFVGLEACVHDGWLVFSDYKDLDKQFLYYYFLNFRRVLEHSASGTVFKNLKTEIVANLDIKLPSVQEQVGITKVLSILDEKIELLQEQNKTLETIAQTLFKQWFVDFEFPDKEGKPYKSSGGKMVKSALGEIPEGWEVGSIGDIVNIYDSKRIPLSSQERLQRKGEYRYYGATKVMDYVDDYLFDGVYLLFAEDGSVMDEKGFPILQYVWGKFWVNNHAHVLQGANYYTTEMLYLLFERMHISDIVNGAVQLKINQTNLLSKSIVIANKETVQKFSRLTDVFFQKRRHIEEQINSLSLVRNTLLPKLITGDIRVKT